MSVVQVVAKALTGKVKELPYKPLEDNEIKTFESDFADLVAGLRKLDDELADTFDAAYEFYLHCAGIFKGIINRPFGGIEPSTGQFGMRLLMPQDFIVGGAIWSNTWLVDLTAGWQDLWGSASTPVSPNNERGREAMFAFHTIVSYGYAPKLEYIKFWVNGYTYPVWSIHDYCKVKKLHKAIWMIHLPKYPLITTDSQFYTRVAAEEAGKAYLRPLGLTFATFEYLREERWKA